MTFLLLLAAAAAPLPDCSHAMTQADMTACAGKEYDAADAAMTGQWEQTLKAMRARDKATATISPRPAGPGYADALLAAQRAWLAFRDAECRVEGYKMRGGSAEAMVELGCKADVTRARTQQLAHTALEN